MLYEFYKKGFLLDIKSEEIVNELVKSLHMDSKFVFSNLYYLSRCGYLSSKDSVFDITYRGIKFVEKVTDGNVSFSDKDIISNKDFIVTQFQKEINNNNND